MARVLHRARAPRRAVELRDVLPRRGRGRRRPRRRSSTPPRARSRSTSSPPSRSTRRATRSSSSASCTRSSGVGDGTIAGGAARPPSPSSPGASARRSRCSTSHRRAAPRPLAHHARAGGDDVPRRRRGDARPARPALHLRLPRRSATLLPGFRAGMQQRRARRAAPHRLRRQAAARPRARGPARCPTRSPTCCARCTPYSLAVFVPPGWDRRYTECFGFTLEEIYEEGARSFEAKLRAAGLPLESLPGPSVVPAGPAARASAPSAALAMLRAGFLGERQRRAAARPGGDGAAVRLASRRAVDPRTRARRARSSLQWEFPDAEPWHVRLDNGSTAAAPGRAPDADVELEVGFDDWVDVVAGRLDPRSAVATGGCACSGSTARAVARPRRVRREARSEKGARGRPFADLRRVAVRALRLSLPVGCPAVVCGDGWRSSSRCTRTPPRRRTARRAPSCAGPR